MLCKILIGISDSVLPFVSVPVTFPHGLKAVSLKIIDFISFVLTIDNRFHKINRIVITG